MLPDIKNSLWKPHPGPQTLVLSKREFEILYGGARGGGKTDAGINWLLYDVNHPLLRALILRRNADDLRDWIDRAYRIYSKLGAKKAGNPPEFHWPSGAIFRTGHLKDEGAYTKYQGHEYQRILIEELTQISTENLYLNLLASCRSTIPELRPQIFLTTNPGEVGHAWVKARFVDIGPPKTPFYYRTKLEDGTNITLSRIFIPATMDDNPTLLINDPAYVARIEQLRDKDPEKYRAWRHGDWEVFAGQVFNDFRRYRHVIEKQIIPRSDVAHYLWFDWGYRAPFACYASAAIPMSSDDGVTFYRVITYQEWYGVEKHPAEWARLIYNESLLRTNKAENYKHGYVDPSMFNRKADGSISIAAELERAWKKLNGEKRWITLLPGSNNRIQKVATVHNWLSIAPDGLPYWMITQNCVNLIRTLPTLVYDEHKNTKEDVDTTQEDHAYDSCSGGLSMVKFVSLDIGGASRYSNIVAKIRRFKPKPSLQLSNDLARQKAIDLDAFANAKVSSNDWRAI